MIEESALWPWPWPLPWALHAGWIAHERRLLLRCYTQHAHITEHEIRAAKCLWQTRQALIDRVELLGRAACGYAQGLYARGLREALMIP